MDEEEGGPGSCGALRIPLRMCWGGICLKLGQGWPWTSCFFVFLFVYFCGDEQDVSPVPRERLPGGGESSPEL